MEHDPIKRIFTAGLATESNTFGPIPTGLDSFKERWYYPAGTHPEHMTVFSGPLWAARRRAAQTGWKVVEGLVTTAQPGGPTTRAAYETLRDHILSELRAALPVQMVLLGLHGAMVADGYDDCEGDLLERARAIVGPDVVIGATIDPHCHLTAAMVENATLLIAFKEYPHTDIQERALELVDVCAAAARGEIRPVAALADCGLITFMHTTREPARGFVERIRTLERGPGMLSISIAHGFAWGDVPGMGTKVLAYADGNRGLAEATATALRDELVSLRAAMSSPCLGIDEALDRALACTAGPVVVADVADNPGGGASGDSTFILARMLERGIGNAALGPLWDPVAVGIAFDAGIGASFQLRLGGKLGPASGQPLDVRCTVKSLRSNLVMTGLSDTPAELGDSALLDVQGIEIVAVSIRNQAMGTDMFTLMGCELATKSIIVVKSSHHFYASYSAVAADVVYASSPGALSMDLASLPYRRIERPKWPIDKDA